MTAKKKKDNNQSDSPAYKELLRKLCEIIEDAKEKGIDLGERNDLLKCRACGVYEDCAVKEGWVICDEYGKVLNQDRFIIIDSKEKSYHRNKMTYFKTTYMFICTECGAQQKEILRCRMDDDY
ncbi:MAG: hypothetical protein KKF78_11315 [Candidatus Omnitrophica bacterium]|nr:hypothetical protein [Candidatus Omnitrophota bacterium]MBU1997725.1 hypothetical protein [Candidatus Omnitrophota bacterium]